MRAVSAFKSCHVLSGVQEWTIWHCYRKNQIDVSFSCVYPVIDHEFRHNIVKVAVDPRGSVNEEKGKQWRQQWSL